MTSPNPYRPPSVAIPERSKNEQRDELARDSNRIAVSFMVCAMLTLGLLLLMITFEEGFFLPFMLGMGWMTLMIAIAWGVHAMRIRREY